METVEVVTRINKDEYNFMKHFSEIKAFSGHYIAKQIVNGTVLPKGHGRLIDVDAFIKSMQTASKTRKYDELWIDNFLTVDDVFNAVIASIKNKGTSNGDAPTVIEADKWED